MDISKGTSAYTALKCSPFIQPPLNKYFIPRPSLPYKAPIDRLPEERNGFSHSGAGSFLTEILDSTPSHNTSNSVVDSTIRLEKNTKSQRQKENEEKLSAQIKEYIQNKPCFKSDPYKTIFVGRLPYSITERQLRREFEIYGPIKSISIVYKPGSPPLSRGYAFIEYEKERSVKIAYNEADGRKLEGNRRCVVDVERGRTVRDWLPRRLGGGLGTTRKELIQGGKGSGKGSLHRRETEKRQHRSPSPRSFSSRDGFKRPGFDSTDDPGYRRSKSPKRSHYSPESAHVYRDFDRPVLSRPNEYASYSGRRDYH